MPTALAVQRGADRAIAAAAFAAVRAQRRCTFVSADGRVPEARLRACVARERRAVHAAFARSGRLRA
eukprot:7950966-Lingulodinium_polyedra.AAC.1